MFFVINRWGRFRPANPSPFDSPSLDPTKIVWWSPTLFLRPPRARPLLKTIKYSIASKALEMGRLAGRRWSRIIRGKPCQNLRRHVAGSTVLATLASHCRPNDYVAPRRQARRDIVADARELGELGESSTLPTWAEITTSAALTVFGRNVRSRICRILGSAAVATTAFERTLAVLLQERDIVPQEALNTRRQFFTIGTDDGAITGAKRNGAKIVVSDFDADTIAEIASRRALLADPCVFGADGF